MTLGERLKHIRKKHDFTLKDLSQRINVTISHLSLIENDKVNPSLVVLRDIGNVYGMSVRDLLIGVVEYDSPPEISDSLREFLLTPDPWIEIYTHLHQLLMPDKKVEDKTEQRHSCDGATSTTGERNQMRKRKASDSMAGRDRQIRVRLTAEELKILHDAAEKANEFLQLWVRKALVSAAGFDPEPPVPAKTGRPRKEEVTDV